MAESVKRARTSSEKKMADKPELKMADIEEARDCFENAKYMEEDSKSNKKGRGWCFTINNPTEAEYEQLAALKKRCDYLVAGREIGESGTHHLQGYCYKESTLRFRELKAILPRAYLAIARAKGKKAHLAWDYCKKDGDFIEFGEPPAQGKRTDLHEFMDQVNDGEYDEFTLMKAHPTVTAKYDSWCRKYVQYSVIENELVAPNIELRKWQEEIKQELDGEIQDRRVIWVWSEDSRTGKSTFMKWLHAVYKRKMMSTDELRKKDVLCAYNNHRIVHIDLTRDQTEDQRNYLKSTLEAMSDCKVQLSGKYVSCEKLVKCHVIVTANQPPVDGLPFRYLEYHLNGNNSWYRRTDWTDLRTDSSGAKYYIEYQWQESTGGELLMMEHRIPEKEAKYMSANPRDKCIKQNFTFMGKY